MIAFEEMQEMLSDMLDELPAVFFEELNGGVTLAEEEKLDPAAKDLYILGEYVEDRLGCSIVLYYGSFCGLFEDCPRAEVRREVRQTLRHEFRHHMEARAGLDDLDVEDAQELAEFIREDRASAAPEESAQEAQERGRREGKKLAAGERGAQQTGKEKPRGLLFWKK